MQTFGLRYLYKHLGQALAHLPFAISNHNRIIAVVVPPEAVTEKRGKYRVQNMAGIPEGTHTVVVSKKGGHEQA